jgi:hypothetical protein
MMRQTIYVSFDGMLRVAALFLPPPIPRHERLQHVRDQRRRIDCLTVNLSVQRGVAVEVGFQAGRASKGQLDVLGLRQRPEP